MSIITQYIISKSVLMQSIILWLDKYDFLGLPVVSNYTTCYVRGLQRRLLLDNTVNVWSVKLFD